MHTAVDASSTLDVHCILRIVDGIYAAACGEATWDQALAQVCQFGRLVGSALAAVDALERQCVALASWETSSRIRLHAPHARIAGDSRLADRILRSTPGVVLDDGEILADAVPGSSSSWMGTEVSWACVIVGREECRVVCLEAYGAAGRAPGGPQPGEFLGQLAPHLVRAWRIGRASRAALATSARAALPSGSHPDFAPAADLAGLPETARLRAEFGLTKAEARLALRLAEGSSLASAAQAFNVKLTTIRSQLQQVFAKTGTSRQTELMALLLNRGYGSRTLPWTPDRSTRAEAALAAW